MQPIQEEDYPEELDLTEEELVDYLQTDFHEREGKLTIKSLMRAISIRDTDLAEAMYNELEYWVKNGKSNRG